MVCCCRCLVAKSCLTLWDPMNCSTPGSPVLHCLPLSRRRYLTTSSSAVTFSSCPQYFPASGPFLLSCILASGGQSTRISASVLPMDIQDRFLLGLTSLISLAVQETFTSIHDYWKNHSFVYTDLCWQSDVFGF